MKAQLTQLFWMTIQNPAQAAQVLWQVQVDRATGWMILALAVTLNTLAYFASLALFPVPPEIAFPLLTKPFLVLTMLGSTSVIFVFAFYWVGRSLGGEGSFNTILLMVGWLQYMRLAIQLGSLLLMIVMPSLAQMFVLLTGLYGLWVVVNFIKIAHAYKTLERAVAVVVLSAIGLTVGLSVFVSLIAVTAFGIS